MVRTAVASRWLAGEDSRLVQIEAELGMLRLDDHTAIQGALHTLAEVLGAASVVVASFSTGAVGLAIEHWRAAYAPPSLRARVESVISRSIRRGMGADPAQVDVRSRNRAFDLVAWLEHDAPGTWEGSPLLHDVRAVLGLHSPRVAGALVYEDDTLLGWFGAVLSAPPTDRQLDTLDTLVPVMQRRLGVERILRSANRQRAALAAALDQIGEAAFVLGPTGAICETNTVARALLANRRDEIVRALADTFMGRETSLELERRPIGPDGGCLATLRASTFDERIGEAVAIVAAQWSLTPRQRDVLDLVVRGHANSTIADWLGVSTRAVELHVTALLDRSGAENRASLVSHVLT